MILRRFRRVLQGVIIPKVTSQTFDVMFLIACPNHTEHFFSLEMPWFFFLEFAPVMATDLHDQPVLRFRKASNFAYTPTRGSELAAGYDLYSSVDCVVKVGGRTLINTDIQVLLLPLPFHIPDQLDSFAPRLLWSDSSPQWTDSKARN